MHLKDLARLRQVAYRLFSSTLRYPEEERLEAMAAAAGELRGQSDAMLSFAFFPQWARLLTILGDLPGRGTLEQEYVRVFMHNPKGTPCLPYESTYVDPGGQAAGWILALLEEEYAAAGLTLSPSLKEQPDHISVELEFMSFLCGQEADAWDRKVVEEGVQALERQAAFVGGHLVRWIPEWARCTGSAQVYSAVAEAAQAFMSHDRDLIALLLERCRGAPEVTLARARPEKRQPPGSDGHVR